MYLKNMILKTPTRMDDKVKLTIVTLPVEGTYHLHTETLLESIPDPKLNGELSRD